MGIAERSPRNFHPGRGILTRIGCMASPYLRTGARARAPGCGRNDSMGHWTLGAWLLVVGCVTNGPASSPDGGSAQSRLSPRPRPSMGAALPGSTPPARASAARPPSPPLVGAFEDSFERAALGPDWVSTGSEWHIETGRLCAKGARNHGVWLARTLPVNARIEFDAVSSSPDGDIKAEVFGDGASAATGVSYNDATSYLTIFGGWKNTFHVLARLNEHASDRPEIKITPG